MVFFILQIKLKKRLHSFRRRGILISTKGLLLLRQAKPKLIRSRSIVK